MSRKKAFRERQKRLYIHLHQIPLCYTTLARGKLRIHFNYSRLGTGCENWPFFNQQAQLTRFVLPSTMNRYAISQLGIPEQRFCSGVVS
uniref:Uncharacterized protein n=1 Tax=Anguilla anguilla TaxID=7936 RepID=A0A0E9WFD6_ANGAN